MSKISLKHSGGNVVSLNSPTSAPASADVAFKLPNQDGSASEALITDGSGNLSFASTGKILQIVQTVKTTNTSTTSQIPTVVDMSGMSINITPSVANSKIEISYGFNIGANTNSIAFIRLNRKIGSGSFTEIFIGTETPSNTGYYATNIVYNNNADAYMNNVSSCFLDTPSYSVGDVITYKLTYASHDGNTIEVNGYPTVTNYSTPSNMIAKEVAA